MSTASKSCRKELSAAKMKMLFSAVCDFGRQHRTTPRRSGQFSEPLASAFLAAAVHALRSPGFRGFLRLRRRCRECSSGCCFHERNISAIDKAVGIQVCPKVRGDQRLAGLAFSERDISRVDERVIVRVTK